MGVYRRGRERITYPWTDDPPQTATIESPGLEVGEGAFAWSAETGVVAVVALVALRKFTVAVVSDADGGAGAVVRRVRAWLSHETCSTSSYGTSSMGCPRSAAEYRDAPGRPASDPAPDSASAAVPRRVLPRSRRRGRRLGRYR